MSKKEAADQTETTEVVTQNTPDADTPAVAKKTDTAEEEYMIPKKRLDQEIERRESLEREKADVQKQLDAALEKLSKAEEQRTADISELQKQIEELKPSASLVMTQEAKLKTLLEIETQSIPENLRALVPKTGTPAEQLEWIAQARNAGLFAAQQPTKARAVDLDASTGSQANSKPAATIPQGTAKYMELAQKRGYTIDQQRVAELAKSNDVNVTRTEKDQE